MQRSGAEELGSMNMEFTQELDSGETGGFDYLQQGVDVVGSVCLF